MFINCLDISKKMDYYYFIRLLMFEISARHFDIPIVKLKNIF